MSEQRKCVCGKSYWWPAASWQHANCAVVHNPTVVHVGGSQTNSQGGSRHGKHAVATADARKEYRREWMRKKRALIDLTQQQV